VTAEDLPGRVLRTIREHNLFSPGDTVVVALSGGADSCALLDILAGMKSHTPRLVVAHLNHCLRGIESDGDEQFARSLAEQYSFPFESRRIDVRDLARRQGLSLEDAGRQARIAFLDDVRTRCKAAAVALAHHADDQAETVLIRLLRGSGMTGLCGMSYRNSRGFIRPLLDTGRAEIEAYLAARGLSHREDRSNRDTTFLRNRIRHELLPLLSSYNPGISNCLTGTAALLADENELLEQLAYELTERACRFEDSLVICSRPLLQEQPAALVRRVFRQILRRLAGSGDHFSRRHISALELLAASPRPNSSIDLPRGIRAQREYDRITLQLFPENTPAGLPGLVISGPGSYKLPFGASLVIAVDAPSVTAHDLAAVRIDLGKAPFPWQLRAFCNGDRFVPLGMSGTKKVKAFFIDEKIPLSARRKIPLIFSGQLLIWICGLRMSQLARTDATSSRVATVIYTAPEQSGNRQLSCKPASDMIDV